jgi:hypothetical protein
MRGILGLAVILVVFVCGSFYFFESTTRECQYRLDRFRNGARQFSSRGEHQPSAGVCRTFDWR